MKYIIDGSEEEKTVQLKLAVDDDGDPNIYANGMPIAYFNSHGVLCLLNDIEGCGLSCDDDGRITIKRGT